MKLVKTASKIIPNEFSQTTIQIKNAISTGWKKGKSVSKINNKGLIKDIYTRSKHVTKEIQAIKIDNKNLPVFAAALAYIAPIPIPGLTIYTYIIAKGVSKISNFINKHKQSKENAQKI